MYRDAQKALTPTPWLLLFLQVLTLLLSQTLVHEAPANGTPSAYYQDLAVVVRNEVTRVCKAEHSGNETAMDSNLLLVLQVLQESLSAGNTADLDGHKQDKETHLNSGSSLDACVASQVLSMAHALLLDLMTCLVRTGLTSKVVVAMASEWAARVVPAAVGPEPAQSAEMIHEGVDEYLTTMTWGSAILWLTRVRCQRSS